MLGDIGERLLRYAVEDRARVDVQLLHGGERREANRNACPFREGFHMSMESGYEAEIVQHGWP